MDVKYVLRRLARSPGFLAAACVSLALGIGANTAAFSVVHAVLFRPLSVEDPAFLAFVSAGSTNFQYSMSYPAYTCLRDHASAINLAIGRERTFAMLSLTFGVLALVLSSVGVIGVMASAASRRRKELGIRLALGAAPSILIRSLLAEAAVLAACGALSGLPAAWLMARAIRGLLFGLALTTGKARRSPWPYSPPLRPPPRGFPLVEPLASIR